MAEKPIIHLIHRSELKLIPFDVVPYRTVPVGWDTPTEVLKSIEELHQYIQAAISAEHVIENPVTKARGRQHLKATASSAEKVLLEELQGLSLRVAALEITKSVSITGVNWSPINLDQGINWVPTNIVPSRIVDVNSYRNVVQYTGSHSDRKLSGKLAVLAGTTDRDGKVIVLVEGKQVHMTKEEWEKLPPWSDPLP